VLPSAAPAAGDSSSTNTLPASSLSETASILSVLDTAASEVSLSSPSSAAAAAEAAAAAAVSSSSPSLSVAKPAVSNSRALSLLESKLADALQRKQEVTPATFALNFCSNEMSQAECRFAESRAREHDLQQVRISAQPWC
jgi:hypothetical protein